MYTYHTSFNLPCFQNVFSAKTLDNNWQFYFYFHEYKFECTLKVIYLYKGLKKLNLPKSKWSITIIKTILLCGPNHLNGFTGEKKEVLRVSCAPVSSGIKQFTLDYYKVKYNPDCKTAYPLPLLLCCSKVIICDLLVAVINASSSIINLMSLTKLFKCQWSIIKVAFYFSPHDSM